MMWGLSYFLLITKDLSRNEGKEKKMKKLLIASLMIIASHSTLAADNKATNKPDVFAKATQLYEAKITQQHLQKCNVLQNLEMLKQSIILAP